MSSCLLYPFLTTSFVHFFLSLVFIKSSLPILFFLWFCVSLYVFFAFFISFSEASTTVRMLQIQVFVVFFRFPYAFLAWDYTHKHIWITWIFYSCLWETHRRTHSLCTHELFRASSAHSLWSVASLRGLFSFLFCFASPRECLWLLGSRHWLLFGFLPRWFWLRFTSLTSAWLPLGLCLTSLLYWVVLYSSLLCWGTSTHFSLTN